MLYYESWETGWVPASKLKDFKQHLEALRGQKTRLLEGLTRAITLATEAEAEADDGGASAVPPSKKRAAVVECSSGEAQALAAADLEKHRGADTGALAKRRRLAQQEPAGCDISVAGCWERGDAGAEALEWQI